MKRQTLLTRKRDLLSTLRRSSLGGSLLRSGLILIWLVSGLGCGASKIDPAFYELARSENEWPEYNDIGQGDKLAVRVFGHEELSGEFTVSSETTISFPLLGRITVAGMTCADLEESLTQDLRKGYLRDPVVSCTVVEYNSRRLYVFGEVQKPGIYPYRANIRVIDVLALAGGFTEQAWRNEVRLSRTIDGVDIQVTVPMQEIVEKRAPNIRVLPGDVIDVPRSPF